MFHSPSPRFRSRCDRRWLSRFCALGIAWLGLGCKNAVVIHPNGSPDAAGPTSQADVGGDAARATDLADAPQWLSVPDMRPGDASSAEDSPCSRSVNLRGVTITRPVPFDVVIVADNSDSLSWSRNSLSAGLKNLLARVHGHQARFFVLTTTQYGASSRDAVSPITGKDLVSWRDSVSGTTYLNPVTTYNQICADGSGAPATCPKPPHTLTDAWKVTGKWQFEMPSPVAAITPEMDDGQIAAQQALIADAILALGGGGSQQEQPICTLLRYIGQSSAALPKHAVFVVLTDEDDTSPPDVCLAGYDAYQVVDNSTTTVPCSSNCPKYQYWTQRPNQEMQLDFTCVPIDDKGTAHPERAVQKTLVSQRMAVCTNSAGDPAAACTEPEITKAGVECGAGTLVQSCKHTCAVVNGSIQCSLMRSDNKTNLCTQPFDVGTVHYANLADYCSRSDGSTWGACEVQGLMPDPSDAGRPTTGYGEHTTPLVSATSTAEMIQTFKSSAERLIGKGNYSIETIVLDPTFSCPVNPGQSYAANLRTLASSSGDVFPLCQDYAPAIERIASFADYLVQTTFPLDLDEYEDIDSVVVTNKQGVQRVMAAASYSYDRTAKLLRFAAGALTAQDDSLAVNVARYCEVIIK
jgi:hypothetical protein